MLRKGPVALPKIGLEPTDQPALTVAVPAVSFVSFGPDSTFLEHLWPLEHNRASRGKLWNAKMDCEPCAVCFLAPKQAELNVLMSTYDRLRGCPVGRAQIMAGIWISNANAALSPPD